MTFIDYRGIKWSAKLHHNSNIEDAKSLSMNVIMQQLWMLNTSNINNLKSMQGCNSTIVILYLKKDIFNWST